MRRMLDPKEAGGSLPSSITFDAEGNRTVGKDLGVDGKLKLKSLVSASNPDGDIRNALDATVVKYKYSIIINNTFSYDVETTKNYNITVGTVSPVPTVSFLDDDNYKELRAIGNHITSGCFVDEAKNIITTTYMSISDYHWEVTGYNITTGDAASFIDINRYQCKFKILRLS